MTATPPHRLLSAPPLLLLTLVVTLAALAPAPAALSGQSVAARSGGAADPPAHHVVLVSVDGFRPDFYLEDRWPAVNLRAMAEEGAHAKGVESVHPSVTYPSHTSMVTGALPARHGIYYNTPFEPGGATGRWYWEAETIEVPTLWDAVREAGGTTAALWWPVTLGADIDHNLPEVWPLDGSDRTETLRRHATPGYLEELEEGAIGRMDDTFRGAVRSRADRMAAMAAHTLVTHHPTLLMVHFTTTDSHQHSHGREHREVERAVQAVDRGIGRIVEAAASAGILEETAIVVTGDHGFSDIHTVVAPNVWLEEAGLLEALPDRGDWRAAFHTAGGSAFLHLDDPEDEEAVAEVEALLGALPPGVRGLFHVFDRAELARMGADPRAELGLSGIDGVSMSTAASGPAVGPGSGGTHGHAPLFAGMETGLVAWGAGVRPGARVPRMGLVDVAPLVAHLLGLDFQVPDGVLLPGLVAPGGH